MRTTTTEIGDEMNKAVIDIEGVSLPDVKEVDGMELKRNGHGVRSINFMWQDIKIYVAGFYTSTSLTSEDDVYSHDGPMQFDFTFLRGVGEWEVGSAWSQQLEYSVSHRDYVGYEKDRDEFIKYLSSPIEHLGTQSVQFIGDNTHIIDQGVHKGTISGKDFQKAFQSMWFGERAVAEDLKDGLLKGSSSASEQQQPQSVVA